MKIGPSAALEPGAKAKLEPAASRVAVEAVAQFGVRRGRGAVVKQVLHAQPGFQGLHDESARLEDVAHRGVEVELWGDLDTRPAQRGLVEFRGRDGAGVGDGRVATVVLTVRADRERLRSFRFPAWRWKQAQLGNCHHNPIRA